MWLEYTFLKNTVLQWLIAAGAFFVSLLILFLIKRVAQRRLSAMAKDAALDWRDLIKLFFDKTRFLLLVVIAVYIASLFLQLTERAGDVIAAIVVIGLLIQATLWGNGFITFWIERERKRRLDQDQTGVITANFISFVARLALFSIVLLLALDNLGIDVTALVASLGVGGIAVALAVQNVLADLFACLSISLDKPFVIGDFIIVGEYLGVVENVGLKTTRIRSLSGEQLVFSNNDLLSSRIRNYKRMRERRVLFSFGVIYQTPYEKLAEIPKMVREIVEAQENVRFDRAHFRSYGESSLEFEVVYYIGTPDYNLYMDTQQAINLALYRRFEESGIEFAYPTRTLYLAGETERVSWTKSS